MRLCSIPSLIAAVLHGSTGLALAAGLLLTSPLVLAQSPPVGLLPAQEVTLRRAEEALLHRKLDLHGLRRLSGGQFVPEAAPRARLMLVHIWAVECRPCIEEMPVLRRIFESLSTTSNVTPLLISETADIPKLLSFLQQNRATVPSVPQYQSTGEQLRASLQNYSQPTTLLVDERGIIREAFLGSLRTRRSELADALYRLIKATQ